MPPGLSQETLPAWFRIEKEYAELLRSTAVVKNSPAAEHVVAAIRNAAILHNSLEDFIESFGVELTEALLCINEATPEKQVTKIFKLVRK